MHWFRQRGRLLIVSYDIEDAKHREAARRFLVKHGAEMGTQSVYQIDDIDEATMQMIVSGVEEHVGAGRGLMWCWYFVNNQLYWGGSTG